MKKKNYDRRFPTPRSTKRACLCRNGTYSRKCCGEDYYSQGVGNVVGDGT